MTSRTLLLLFLIAGIALAQIPSDKELRAFIAFRHAAGLAKVKAELASSLEKKEMASINRGDVSMDRRQAYLAAYDEINQFVKEETDWKKIENEYVEAYRRDYTPDELTQVIAFHMSPLGQKDATTHDSIQNEIFNMLIERFKEQSKIIWNATMKRLDEKGE